MHGGGVRARGADAGLEVTARAHGLMLQAAEAGDAEAYRAAVIEHYRPLGEILAAEAAGQTDR